MASLNATIAPISITTTISPLFMAYNGTGFHWNIAIWALLLNTVGISGQCMNSALIWVTYKTKSLHGTANFHLALGAFFEILHQNGHLLFLFVTFSGQNFLSYWWAVHICTVALFGLGSVALSMTFTALDRLLYIIFPTITFVLKPKPYLTVVTLVCLLSCARNVYVFYDTANTLPDVMITGSMDDILSQGAAKDAYSGYSLALNFVTLAFYIAIAAIMKFKPPFASTGSTRIYKSILILISVNLSGFFAMRIFRLFIAASINPFMTRWYISQTMSLFLNMSTASTGPVLYATSKEYRDAFKKQFRPIFRHVRGCSRLYQANSVVSTIPGSSMMVVTKTNRFPLERTGPVRSSTVVPIQTGMVTFR